MGKFGWDLPPGVTTSMLPGNTPEDAAAEAVADAIYGALVESGCHDVTVMDKAVEAISKLIGDAYAKGSADGHADEAMAQEFGECHNLKNFKDVGDIIGALQHQAALRGDTNDERGCLLKAADALREDLVDLDPVYYGGLNYEG